MYSMNIGAAVRTQHDDKDSGRDGCGNSQIKTLEKFDKWHTSVF